LASAKLHFSRLEVSDHARRHISLFAVDYKKAAPLAACEASVQRHYRPTSAASRCCTINGFSVCYVCVLMCECVGVNVPTTAAINHRVHSSLADSVKLSFGPAPM